MGFEVGTDETELKEVEADHVDVADAPKVVQDPEDDPDQLIKELMNLQTKSSAVKDVKDLIGGFYKIF